MEQIDTFGTWLKRRRRALDLTQGQLADCAGCSLVTIRKFEADERRPSRQLAELLAGCLAVPGEEREAFIKFARQPEMAARTPPPDPLPAAPLPHSAPPPGVPAPPAAQPRAPLVTLPAPLTGLVGREREVEAITGLLLEPVVRIVTLTGPGGTGKTRLAIESGRRLAEKHLADFPDGVVFVDLTPVEDPALVIPVIAEELGVKDGLHRTLAQSLADYVKPRRLLLILDNFEQVIDAADDMLPLLQVSPGLSLLVTSRTVLRLYGEYEYPVPPLTLPPPGAADPEELARSPAVALFVERGRAVRPGFALTAENAAAVAAICARLDGLPLAIELAAARVKLLTPSVLLSQLTSSLDLAAQLRHMSERQRTLRGAIDWSYRLLSPPERRLFARLGVFSGSFGLEAVAAVAELPPPATDPPLGELLGSLIDKSMVQTADAPEGAEPRFRLLAVMREYALEALDALGERNEAACRHLHYYQELAVRIAPLLEQPEQARWLRELSGDHDNLRAALAFGLEEPEQRAEALRLVSALRSFWRFRGLFTEGRQWLGQLLADAPAAIPPEVLASAYSTAGMLARYQDNHDEALPLLHKSLDYYHQLGEKADRHQMAITLRNIAAIYYWREELELTEQYTRDILEIERELGNLPAVATMLGNLASVNKLLGRFDLTRAYQLEALALHRQVSGPGSIISSLNGLGLLEFHEGNLAESQRLYEEALAMARTIEDPYHQAMLLANLAEGKMVMGRLAESRSDLEESLDLARAGGFTRLEMTGVFNLGLLHLLEGREPREAWPPMRQALCYWRDSNIKVMVDVSLYPIALLFSRLGRDEEAVRLVSYVDSRTRNPVRAPDFEMMLAEIKPAARSRLGDGAYRAAEAAGRAMTTDEAIDLADQTGDAIVGGRPPVDELPAPAAPEQETRGSGERLLAVGGMGEVFLTQDDQGRPVVVKRLRPEFLTGRPDILRRFEREGELLRRLNHPNIVKMLDARQETDGRYAIRMEYVPGGTLRELLEREGRLPVQRAIAIALELADALARAHHLGVIHRDVKPENVLLAADGTPRLTDFGLAFHRHEAARLTQPGTILGTIAYLSPEACQGEEPGAAGDIWALGVMMLEMITGQHPYLRDNATATLLAIISAGVPDSPDGVDVPPRLATLIGRMLEQNPKRRISSARQVAAELERILAG